MLNLKRTAEGNKPIYLWDRVPHMRTVEEYDQICESFMEHKTYGEVICKFPMFDEEYGKMLSLIIYLLLSLSFTFWVLTIMGYWYGANKVFFSRGRLFFLLSIFFYK